MSLGVVLFDSIDKGAIVATHFEKITHFKFFFQSAL